jgi:hypothetical protein
MSDEERRNGDIERYNRGRLDSSSDGNHVPTSSNSSDGHNSHDSPANSSSIADAVSGSLSRRDAVTVESDSVRATLVGIPTIDVEEFVYSHQMDDGGEHAVALFDVENTTDSPLKWQTSRTQFVGDDEYTYQPARLTLDPSQLGPGCHTRQVELPPGRRARVVTLVEVLPPGVEIAEVVHSLPAQSGLGGRERLVFSL